MKRLLARARAWLTDPDQQYMAMSVVTAALLSEFIRQTSERVHTLESRGWVPADDVATIGDLDRLRAEVGAAPAPEQSDPPDPA